jgi:site-specific recombinase XerD
MTAEEEKIAKDFTDYEKIRGIRSLKKLKYELKPFFEYINNSGIKHTSLNHREAQNYQTYLATLTNPDGSIHYAVRTIQSMVSTAANLYNYLKYIKKVFANPFKNIKLLKKENKLPRNVLEEDKLIELLSSMKCFWNEKTVNSRRYTYRAHVISEVMYGTGLRINETANLEEKDIDFEKGIVAVRCGKGGKDRISYLNEYALKILRLYIEKMREVILWNKASDKIFGTKDGKNLDCSFNRILKEKSKSLKLDRFTSHAFRHCLGFHLLRRGCDMRYIQLILGHDDLKSTSVYTKVDKKDLKCQLDKYHPRKIMNKGAIDG